MSRTSAAARCGPRRGRPTAAAALVATVVLLGFAVPASGGSPMGLASTGTVPGAGTAPGTPTEVGRLAAGGGLVAEALGTPSEPALVPVEVVGPGAGSALSARRVRAVVADELGTSVPAAVVDVATGQPLVASRARAAVPASTMKLVTAAAALHALGPDTTLATRTLLQRGGDSPPRVVIVGAGDSSLTSQSRSVGLPGTRAYPTSTAELARRTARALSRRGVTRVRVAFDDSLFTGPAMHPDWSRSFPAAGVVTPVSALMVDHGARVPRGTFRVPDPAAAAGRTFAAQLAKSGLKVVGPVRRTDLDPDAAPLAQVDSPTIGQLVERMLGTSDNDLAESLARLAAAAGGFPASFSGVAKHNRETLQALGVATGKLVLRDGSGLSRRNRLTPRSLTDLLVTLAGGPDQPVAAAAGTPSATPGQSGALRHSPPTSQSPAGEPPTARAEPPVTISPVGWTSPLLSGLPVAGVSGSLRARFDDPAEVAGRSVVRAKTGTLTGVVTLAGYASRPDGRLLAFAFLDDRATSGAMRTRDRLDRAAAALVSCRCRK